MKKKNGFTLAELLIVIAIIAVLVAIAIPVVQDSLGIQHDTYSYRGDYGYTWRANG